VHVASIRQSAGLGHKLRRPEADYLYDAASISSAAYRIWISRLILSEAAELHFQLSHGYN
jgi:hypothetical protein